MQNADETYDELLYFPILTRSTLRFWHFREISYYRCISIVLSTIPSKMYCLSLEPNACTAGSYAFRKIEFRIKKIPHFEMARDLQANWMNSISFWAVSVKPQSQQKQIIIIMPFLRCVQDTLHRIFFFFFWTISSTSLSIDTIFGYFFLVIISTLWRRKTRA